MCCSASPPSLEPVVATRLDRSNQSLLQLLGHTGHGGSLPCRICKNDGQYGAGVVLCGRAVAPSLVSAVHNGRMAAGLATSSHQTQKVPYYVYHLGQGGFWRRAGSSARCVVGGLVVVFRVPRKNTLTSGRNCPPDASSASHFTNTSLGNHGEILLLH